MISPVSLSYASQTHTLLHGLPTKLHSSSHAIVKRAFFPTTVT
jgi:hypothetical protein